MSKYKNYKERAEYLSFINPKKSEMYEAIADFFREDEVPPIKTWQKKREEKEFKGV